MIDRNEIEAALAPALDLIKDAGLRQKTVDAWMMAIEEGGWRTMDELRAMPFTLLADCKGVNLIQHTLAVTLGAVGLAKGQMQAYDAMPYRVDMDRLVAGGILHDVGKLVEISRGADGKFVKSKKGKLARHPISGAIIAAKADLSDEVVNCVACHAKEGEGAPQVVETVLIHQADFATFDPLVMMGKGTLVQ